MEKMTEKAVVLSSARIREWEARAVALGMSLEEWLSCLANEAVSWPYGSVIAFALQDRRK